MIPKPSCAVFSRIETGQPLRFARRPEQSHRLLANFQTIFDKPANRERIDPMFGAQHPCRQRLLIVAGEHRHGGLNDDRSAIKLPANQVHGCAMNLDPGLQGLPVRPQSRERRQQRRMNIHQSTGETIDKGIPKNAHVACQHNQ
jgi:hypothetical protein